MEGLIPLVYKALKKSRTRGQYECLSSGSALAYINEAEIFLKPSSENQRGNSNNAGRKKLHRRYSSVEDLSMSVASPYSPPQKQLVRFRSHRMFSCVTGN
ncbi:hypothetical protein JCGZ_19258 [Jatropha curcas]|uniref:Uncharacterized protein n=1 Tax=Jatropha curcas TaxID=180498 RepID=A0A067KB98_JATCU|nr:uncharacterized protein LOC105641876 [Jatropha curcas]KDP29545.1 hypothetical protein JCGZ_19258 [Jatropha curcas]